MRFQWQRRQMIADIEFGVAITRNQIGRDHFDVRVIVVMRQVPREVSCRPICDLVTSGKTKAGIAGSYNYPRINQ